MLGHLGGVAFITTLVAAARRPGLIKWVWFSYLAAALGVSFGYSIVDIVSGVIPL